jgi:hypothetical protein
MANSLKAMLPALGRILGETPDALYGWQRAMVREGLLESTPGRGPGSGTPATAQAVAQFLIGVCCQATRLENVPRAKSIAKAKAAGKCSLTGAKTFVDALAAILADRTIADRVRDIRIAINCGLVDINFDAKSNSTFLDKWGNTAVMFQATIMPDTLRKIGDLLRGEQ